jgi:cobalt-zinc-cadmium efflux system protein
MGHNHSHDHSHESGHAHGHVHRGSSRRALSIALVIITGFFVAEAIGGFFTGSLALLADAGHLLTDVGALILALFAFWLAERPATLDRSYGNLRVEIVAALINGLTLLLVAVFIGLEAYDRFLDPPEVASLPMLVIATVGLVGQTASAFILHRSSEESLNAQAAFIHVATDAVQSLGVVAAGVLMLTLEWWLADPVMSMAIAVLIAWSGGRIAWSSIYVLMEGTPQELDSRAVAEDMEGVSGVRDVHDFHIWTITSGYYALSAHVALVDGLSPQESQNVLTVLHNIASERYRIQHVTIQLETAPPEWPEGSHPTL